MPMAARNLDFLLDDDGDLVIESGDFRFASDQTGIRQLVKEFLAFFLEEWFLDESIGVPYFQRIFIKNPSLIEVREYIRQTILLVPGINDVTFINIQYSGSRIASINWRASTDLGELKGSEVV